MTLQQAIVQILKQVPRGKVATYGQIARLAGFPRAARQVAWVLHSTSRKEDLPWQRIVNAQGKISLPAPEDYALQKALLEDEGIVFDARGRIDLTRYRW